MHFAFKCRGHFLKKMETLLIFSLSDIFLCQHLFNKCSAILVLHCYYCENVYYRMQKHKVKRYQHQQIIIKRALYISASVSATETKQKNRIGQLLVTACNTSQKCAKTGEIPSVHDSLQPRLASAAFLADMCCTNKVVGVAPSVFLISLSLQLDGCLLSNSAPQGSLQTSAKKLITTLQSPHSVHHASQP